MAYPTFASGDVLNASDMNAVGLWLVKTQTIGTAVSSVEVTSAFSSTYDNYLILLSGGTCSADTTIGLQLGASATAYYGFLTYGAATASTVLGANVNNSATANFVGGGVSGQAAHVRCDVLGPNKSAYTKIVVGSYQNGNNYGTFNCEHRVATAYTSFTLLPSSGTLTGGTIRVYGYRN
jgi:NADPH-dependent curcumin reductase CurA